MKLADKITMNKRLDELKGLKQMSLAQLVKEFMEILCSGEVLTYNENVDAVVIGRYQDLKDIIIEMCLKDVRDMHDS